MDRRCTIYEWLRHPGTEIDASEFEWRQLYVIIAMPDT